MRIKTMLADSFYGSKGLFEGAVAITGCPQVISQIKKTQLINVNGKFIQAQKFFENYSGKTEVVMLRHKDKLITYRGAKFKVKSHAKRLRVIALKYEGETIVTQDDPKALFEAYSGKIAELFALKSSLKHMRGVNMETLAPMS